MGEIAVVVFLKALILGAYQAMTGKEAFPANPKGPLYKWFGRPNRPN